MNNMKKTASALLLAYLAFLVHDAISQKWFELFIDKRFFTAFRGININLLVEQIPIMLIYVSIGILGYFIFDSKFPHGWPIAVGIIASIIRRLTSRTSFTAAADITDKINFYYTYAYPPLFAFFGAAIVAFFYRRKGDHSESSVHSDTPKGDV